MRSAAAYYDGDAWDILLQKADVKKCLPIVDVLTLAATGSEMDAGGVISNPDTKDKIGLSFAPMLPNVSFHLFRKQIPDSLRLCGYSLAYF